MRVGGPDPEVFDDFLGHIETTLSEEKIETQQLNAVFGIDMVSVGRKQRGVHERHGNEPLTRWRGIRAPHPPTPIL